MLTNLKLQNTLKVLFHVKDFKRFTYYVKLIDDRKRTRKRKILDNLI